MSVFIKMRFSYSYYRLYLYIQKSLHMLNVSVMNDHVLKSIIIYISNTRIVRIDSITLS